MAYADIEVEHARRMARATVRVERARVGDAPRSPNRGAGASQLGVLRAVVTTAIPTGTFASPSTSGAVQIYHKNALGVWAADGDPLPVNNDMKLSASVPVGTTVRVAYISGEVWTVGGECY